MRDKKGRFTDNLAINRCAECNASLAHAQHFVCGVDFLAYCSAKCWKEHAKTCEHCYRRKETTLC